MQSVNNWTSFSPYREQKVLVSGSLSPLVSQRPVGSLAFQLCHLNFSLGVGPSSEENFMGPRWKRKGSEAKALAEPMSKVVSDLQLSLTNSDIKGLISGCSILLEAEPEQFELLSRGCFGRLIVTSQKDKLWYELGLEEVFYLYYALKCLKIVGNDGVEKNDAELWHYMNSKVEMFPELYKAYSHMRMKNWIVRSGSRYGVDYVAHCHHPGLVHSECTVLVLSDRNGSSNGWLRLWSDLCCALRLSGVVAKTLLVLHVEDNGSEADSPTCLKNYGIKEHTLCRWIAEQTCEEKKVDAKLPSGAKK